MRRGVGDHIRLYESHWGSSRREGRHLPVSLAPVSIYIICIYYMYIYTSASGRSAGSMWAAWGRRASIRCTCVYVAVSVSPIMSVWIHKQGPWGLSITYYPSRRKTRLVDGVEERDGAGVQDRVGEGQGQLQIHQRVRGAMDLAVYVCCGTCARVSICLPIEVARASSLGLESTYRVCRRIARLSGMVVVAAPVSSPLLPGPAAMMGRACWMD